MLLTRRDWLRIAICLALVGGAGAARAGVPVWLPRYDVNMEVDVAGHNVPVQMRATWTNPHPTPTDKLIFNSHAHYIVPGADVGLMAKTLEIYALTPAMSWAKRRPLVRFTKSRWLSRWWSVERMGLTPPAR